MAGVALPTAPRQSGSALQDLHCLLPQGSGAVQCRSCAAHRPQAVPQCVAGVALPTAPGAGRRCIAGVPMPTAPRQWGSALQEVRCPLPPCVEAVHCGSFTAHCPQAVR